MLVSLLGQALKGERVVALLEEHDLAVVYDFDRHFEGMPDVYWVAAKRHGFQLRFDAAQRLDCVFCYVQPAEGFAAIDPDLVGVPLYATFAAAGEAARRDGLRHRTSAQAGMGRDWFAHDHTTHSAHYAFRDGLALVTLTPPAPD